MSGNSDGLVSGATNSSSTNQSLNNNISQSNSDIDSDNHVRDVHRAGILIIFSLY